VPGPQTSEVVGYRHLDRIVGWHHRTTGGDGEPHANGRAHGSRLRSLLAALAVVLLLLDLPLVSAGQSEDLVFLEQMTRDVVQACRIPPGQSVKGSSTNSVGFTLIMPGGNGGYPAFWVRDFAMSLDAGCIAPQEMSNHLQLIARSQNGAVAVHLAHGLVLPPYAIPDHIEFDGGATFYPGTYATGTNQGNGTYGLLPPADDYYWFIHVAFELFRAQGSAAFLSESAGAMRLIDRLAAAFDVPPTDPQTGLFETSATNRAVGFGFCDGIDLTGKVLFPSLLRYQAAGEMAALCRALGQPDAANRYQTIRLQISAHLAGAFTGPARLGGWLAAATGMGDQADVWGTLYALHLGAISGETASAARAAILHGVTNQSIACYGAVRHVPATLDYSARSAWQPTTESLNTYQNGAYWHTATGWLIEALAATNSALAVQVSTQYIQYLRDNDYRLGKGPQAPWECFYPPTGYTQNGVYMTSVTVPYAVISRLKPRNGPWQAETRGRGEPLPSGRD